MTRGVLALAAVVALTAACSRGSQPQLSRTEGVPASGEGPDLRRWCDAFYADRDAPVLLLPAVKPARADSAVPTVPRDRWVWVNVWATWCGPCRREMPLLLDWHERLVREGDAVDVWFLSVDDRAADLARFLSENPGVAPGVSLWLASPGGLDPWLARYPGAPTGSIPLQVIAAPGAKVRCIRAGSLRDGDYPIVRSLVGS